MENAPQAPEQKTGVAGRLLFFVVASFIVLILEVGELKPLVESVRVFGFMAADAVIFFCIAVGVLGFLAYALFRVAVEKRGAVRLIKRALFLYGLVGVGEPIISFGLSRLVAEFDLLTWGDVLDVYRDVKLFGPITRAAVYSVVSYGYFCVSPRVKSTWPETRGESPESVFS